MSNANLEASLTIKAGVKGLETISKLGDEIESAGVDVSHLRDESKELNKTFNELDKNQSLINSFKELKTTVTSTNTAWAEAQDKTAKLAKKWQQAKAHAEELKKEIEAQGKETKEQQAIYQKAVATADKLEKSYKKSASQAKNLKKQNANYNASLNETRKAMQQAGLSSKNLAETQLQLKTDSEKAEQALSELNDETQRLYKIAQAKITLGIDADTKAKRAIQEVTDAYQLLKKEGKLTSKELAIANDLHKQKVKQLESQISTTTPKLDKLSAGVKGVSASFGGLQGMLATLGVTIGATELLQMADDFKTLEARVKLATGEGANFIAGFEGVKQIANDTFTSIEDTGELFARITQASESLNLAQKDILSITESINQAVKLSGGSVESNKAAITQLIQGLQSGIVRGEEFNSIMEQAPRLAQAMADGLGVTRGELRAMAQEGKLTSEVVIGAIQGQSDAIANEFGKLPVTVGNSLIQLKNNIISFVGDIDKEINSSGGLASVIQGISDGIEDIDPVTIEAVKSAFTQLGSAVKEIYDLVANVGGAFNDVLNTVAGIDESAEQVSFLTRTVQGLSIAFGAVADVVKGLQITFDLALGGITSALSKFYGGLAQIELLPDDIQAKYQQMSDSLEAMSDKSFARMEENVNNYSSSTIQALDNASRSQQQILDDTAEKARLAYEQMAQDATVSASKLEEVFVDYAVKAINANKGVVDERLKAELAERNLQAVISDTGKVTIEQANSAIQSAQTIKDAMATTAQSLGIDFELASNKVSQSMQKSVTDVQTLASNFDALKEQGYNASNLIAQGLQNMADKAKNKADYEKLIQLWQQFGVEGKVSTTQVEAGLNAINAKMQKSPELLDETKKAFQELGIISKAEAEKQAQAQIEAYKKVQASGQASTEQLQEALENMSSKIEASSDTAVQSWYEAEKATQEFGMSVDDVSNRIDDQRQSIEQVQQADNEATASQISNASNLHNVILDVTNATRGKISVLQQLGATAEQTKQAYDSIMQSQFFEGQRWASIEHFANDMNALGDSIDRQIAGFKQAHDSAIFHTQALSGANVTTKDLIDAQHALSQAADANVEGLIRMDNQTLRNLQSAINSTKNKMEDLAETAEDTADAIELALAKERGEDTKVREIEQSKKMSELEDKLEAAKGRGNADEIADYERAIRAQRELNKEQDKNAKKRKQAEQTRATKRRTNNNQSISRNTQQTQRTQGNNKPTNIPNVSINIDTSKLGYQLSDAMSVLVQNEFEGFVKDLATQIKRTAK